MLAEEADYEQTGSLVAVIERFVCVEIAIIAQPSANEVGKYVIKHVY